MTRPLSITLRLSLLLGLSTLLLWLGAAAIAVLVLKHELTETFDDALRQSALRLLPLAVHELREPDEDDEYRVPGLEGRDSANFGYLIRDPRGRTRLVSGDVPPTSSIPSPAPEGFFDLDGRRALSLTDPRRGYSILLVETGSHRQDVLFDAARALLLPLAALLPLIALGIWATVRFAMRPLGRLRNEIAERGGGNLKAIPTDGHPRELAPIAEEIASLLSRLRAALDAERSFSAMSAHELRTPIAGALAQVQQLRAELGDLPQDARAQSVEDALKSLATLSEKLLQLARLESGFARAETPTDLLPVLKLLLREAGDCKFDLREGADLTLFVNPDAFSILLSNLLQNARKHGGVSPEITVIAGPGKRLSVANSGPVVAPETLEKLGRKFVRGDTTARGTGLGLALVKTIAEQTGGKVTFLSPRPGHTGGFEAVVTWPVVPRS
ncbi:sensor histidine kinase [Roseibium sediminicola]|uniref:histidine kinase n=1 Tax=Roseibium sediminicola TaxID=2933272 RepID=A0ABT0GZ13_9HYPH|nr:HAMP domain-containing sensor histidine kinase [Roseibium sp. CAU 1639]MCK7614675.1 HAMP domain-containing histidine kinase [Roseibium sp. CAU 1639]